MRISTLQMYRQSVDSMQSQQSKLQQTELQLASGKRIQKPSDDPTGAARVVNLTSNIEVIDQFSRNISGAESSLALEENIIASASNSLQRIRELTVQGNNATNTDADRASIAQEIYQRLDELLALANTKDARGEYIFGGFQVDTPPFVKNAGVVSYVGDQGQRNVQVGEGTQIAVRDSGDSVFQRIPGGDGNIEVSAAAGNNGTAIVGAFGQTSGFVPDTYTITFAQASATAPVTYTVTNSGGGTVATGNYNSGDNISFTGVQFRVDGVPADGDSVIVRPSQNRDVFGSVKALADALSRPTSSTSDKARLHNEVAQGLANIDGALEHFSTVRSSIGARLNNIDSIDNINQDLKLQLETLVSDTQDLDFAEAISRFNLQLTSLKAAQQAFIKTSGLTLFQYL